MQHQVAKIDGVHRHQALLVLAVEIHRPALRETAGIGGRNLLGAETAILPTLNLSEQKAGGPAPLVDVLRLQDLLQQPDLVIGVEDREARLEPDRLGVPAQDARGDRMKGAEPHAFGGAADHRFQPLAHLARRLVGEGDGEQFRGKARPVAIVKARRVVSTRVLPVPAPASTSTGPSIASTARRCASLRPPRSNTSVFGRVRTAGSDMRCMI